MIEGVERISHDTIWLVSEIKRLMSEYKTRMRDGYRFYSQDLLNNLFRHPYTRIEYVMSDLSVSRPTASRYLDELRRGGLVERIVSGRDVYFVNTPLISLFIESFGE